MKKKILTFAAILPLIQLTSCVSYSGQNPLIRDGDSLYLAENAAILDYLTAVDSSNNQVIRLINANETFLLYIGSSTCSSCTVLNESLLPNLQSTYQEVYYIDISTHEGQASYVQLAEAFPLYFYDLQTFGTIVGTPHIYLAKGSDGIESLNNTFFENSNTLSNHLKQYFYETQVYNFSKYDNIKSYIDDSEELVAITYSRSNASQQEIFKNEIESYLLSSKRNIAILDYDSFSSEDKNSAKEFLETQEDPSLILSYKINGQITSYDLLTNEKDIAINLLQEYYI